jgi:predicted MFS family arabinose efflux permease
VAGSSGDVAQAMIVTAWNLAIVGGAILGGALLDRYGARSLPGTALTLLFAAAATRLPLRREAVARA